MGNKLIKLMGENLNLCVVKVISKHRANLFWKENVEFKIFKMYMVPYWTSMTM